MIDLINKLIISYNINLNNKILKEAISIITMHHILELYSM